MRDLNISFDSEINPDELEKINKTALKVFHWLCLTFNNIGFIPHIYELSHNSMKFVLRKIAGTKMVLKYDHEIKIASLANFMFRVRQSNWPVVVARDIVEGKYFDFWRINVTGEPQKITETYEETTTLSRLESDLPVLQPEHSPHE